MQLPGGYTVNAPGGAPQGGTNMAAKVIGIFFQSLLLFIFVYTLWMLFRAAWAMIYSEGDKQRVQLARERLTWAIMGLIVSFAGFFIVSVIGHIFSVNLLQFP